MPSLRVAVLLLMLVLLPLRGWAGGAMALEHTPQAPKAGHAHAQAQEMTAAASPCHGAPAAQFEAADTDAGTNASGHTCSLCDVCHSQLLAATPVATSVPSPGATHPILRGAAFASAPARHHLKPPRA